MSRRLRSYYLMSMKWLKPPKKNIFKKYMLNLIFLDFLAKLEFVTNYEKIKN